MLRASAAALLLSLAMGAAAQSLEPGATLAKVRARGTLLCGIDRSEAEYSSTDEHGNRAAFDRDLCTAVAVAAMGPGARIVATYYADDTTSLQALADGKADMIASVSTHSHAEDASARPLPSAFSAPVLRDATGLMVLRSANITSASQLSGRKICYLTETATEDHLQSWFDRRHLDLLPFPFQEEGEMEAAFVTGNCVGMSGDLTRLAQTRASTGSRAGDYALLQQTFGEDALAMAYRTDDPQWGRIVNAMRNVLLSGDNGSPSLVTGGTTGRLQEPDIGTEAFPLSTTWKQDVVASVGTYRDILVRTLGEASALNMADVWEMITPAR